MSRPVAVLVSSGCVPDMLRIIGETFFAPSRAMLPPGVWRSTIECAQLI
jgi:hypothetical protein